MGTPGSISGFTFMQATGTRNTYLKLRIIRHNILMAPSRYFHVEYSFMTTKINKIARFALKLMSTMRLENAH